jgi:hypothetical protein
MPNEGGLTDREAAIDAPTRLVCGVDKPDVELFSSSLTEDAILDLSPFSKIGIAMEPVHGRDKITETFMKKVGYPLDTTHMTTNIRCFVTGDRATLTCTVLAQHFRGGEGPIPQIQEFLMNGNQYECDIVRDGPQWRISKLVITPTWSLGNPDVMKV